METKKYTGDNPLLQQWTNPYETPPFDRLLHTHYAPAINEAIQIAEERLEIIASDDALPDFENTIVALETATQELDRCTALMFNINECATCDEMQRLVLDMMPELTRFDNRMWMDDRLFAKVKSLYEGRDNAGYDAEQIQLLEKYYQHFVRNGVGLDGEKRERFKSICEELATLGEQFNQNALGDTNEFVLHIDDEAQLGGLPERVVATAREEAVRRGVEGWVFTLQAPSYRPFMSYADNRTLRETMWRAYNSRGNRGNGNDNNEVVRRIAELRMEKAQLLGYDDYASYSLCMTMAETKSAVNRFLDGLLTASLPFARRDLEDVRNYAREHGATYELENWDFGYWSELLKKERYDFDSEQLRPYFQLEAVRKGIFDLYGCLYGLVFNERKDIPVYNDDVMVFEVRDGSRHMGILYLDMYPRENKRSGAWMTDFRGQRNIGGEEVRPLIQVVCNFTKPVAGIPSLLSFDEVETFMHEMGHAMHGMLSDVRYPSLSGTSVRHDFVEMPSQVMENWCYEPEFLNTFARHYKTGEQIPAEQIEKLRRAENFQAGWLCLRQLNFGTTDMAFHTISHPLPQSVSVEQFEHANMTELLPAVEGACVSTSFTHIFSGGYAAGYYGYKWAEVLDADIFSRFKRDGIFNSGTAHEFRDKILSRGGSEHPSVLFRSFMGRDPDNKAFLRRCGFETN